ncbi:polysaccharide deacetylase family protein [Erythrobacter sp. NE805]|uniref:polysaccharide deacetylase family protein n=1 Tax=Erythrobacter sp. NE805 TaxID=3389875 RepID=UPI00396AF683
MIANSMLDVPPPGRRAGFAPAFGQRVLLTVDTEEEFDWRGPFRREGHGLSHVAAIPRFQAFCEGLGVVPVYLVDWPVVHEPRAVEIIRDAIGRGRAEVGIQLHPWVNPPFEEEVTMANSFAGNLPRALEAAKFGALHGAICAAFGTAPLVYRAGRYGLGPHTAELLTRHGIRIDTSVRPLFDYSPQGGPDYIGHPLDPYWADEDRTLLELPVTSVHAGALSALGRRLRRPAARLPRALGALSRLGLLERIPLTPEGVSIGEALRGVDIAVASGLPVLVLSLHSPSLAPGHTPYAATPAAVDGLYAWLAAVYARLAEQGVRPCTIAEVIAATGG